MKNKIHEKSDLPGLGFGHTIPYPHNLVEDLMRMRSLGCNLESLGYPRFLVRLYRRALHCRKVMS